MSHDFEDLLGTVTDTSFSESSFDLAHILPNTSVDAPFFFKSLPQLKCRDCAKSQNENHYDQSSGYYCVLKNKPGDVYFYPTRDDIESARLLGWINEGVVNDGWHHWVLNAQSALNFLYDIGNVNRFEVYWTGSYHDSSFVLKWEFLVHSVSGKTLVLNNASSANDASKLFTGVFYTAIQVGDVIRFKGGIYATRGMNFRVNAITWGEPPIGAKPSLVSMELDHVCTHAALTDTGGAVSGLSVDVFKTHYAPIPWEYPVVADTHLGYKIKLLFDPKVDDVFVDGWNIGSSGTAFKLPAPIIKTCDYSVTGLGTVTNRYPIFVMTPLPVSYCEFSDNVIEERSLDLPNNTQNWIGFENDIVYLDKRKTVYRDLIINFAGEVTKGTAWEVELTLPTELNVATVNTKEGLSLYDGDGIDFEYSSGYLRISGTTGEYIPKGKTLIATLELNFALTVSAKNTAIALPFSPSHGNPSEYTNLDFRTFVVKLVRFPEVSETTAPVVYSDVTNTFSDYSYLGAGEETVGISGALRVTHSSDGVCNSYLREGFLKYLNSVNYFTNWDLIEISYNYEAERSGDRKFRATVPRRCSISRCYFNGEIGVSRDDGKTPDGKWTCQNRVYREIVGFTGGQVQVPVWSEDFVLDTYDNYHPKCYQVGTCKFFTPLAPSKGAFTPQRLSKVFQQLFADGSIIVTQINVGNANPNSWVIRRIGCPSISFLTQQELMRMPVTFSTYSEPIDNGLFYDVGQRVERESDGTFVADVARIFSGYAFADKAYPNYASQLAQNGIMPSRIGSDWTTKNKSDKVSSVDDDYDFGSDLRRHERRYGYSYLRETFGFSSNGWERVTRPSEQETRLLIPQIGSVFNEEQLVENGKTKFLWKFYNANFAELSAPLVDTYGVDSEGNTNFDAIVPEGAVYFGKIEVGEWTRDNHSNLSTTSFMTAEIASFTRLDSTTYEVEFKNKITTLGRIISGGPTGSYDKIEIIMAGGQTVALPNWARLNNRYSGSIHLSNGPHPGTVKGGDVIRLNTVNKGNCGFYIVQAKACSGGTETYVPSTASRTRAFAHAYYSGSTPNTMYRKEINKDVNAVANIIVTNTDASIVFDEFERQVPFPVLPQSFIPKNEYFWRTVVLPKVDGEGFPTGAMGTYLEVWFSDQNMPDVDGVTTEEGPHILKITINYTDATSEGPHNFTLARPVLVFVGGEPHLNKIYRVTLYYGLSLYELSQENFAFQVLTENWPYKIDLVTVNNLSKGFPIPDNPTSMTWPGNFPVPRLRYYYGTFTYSSTSYKGIILPAIAANSLVEVEWEDSNLQDLNSSEYFDLTAGLCPGRPVAYKDWANKRDKIRFKDDTGLLVSDTLSFYVGQTVSFTREGKVSLTGTPSLHKDVPFGGTRNTINSNFSSVASGLVIKNRVDGDLFLTLARGKELFEENNLQCLAVNLYRMRHDNNITGEDTEIYKKAVSELNTVKVDTVASNIAYQITHHIVIGPHACTDQISVTPEPAPSCDEEYRTTVSYAAQHTTNPYCGEVECVFGGTDGCDETAPHDCPDYPVNLGHLEGLPAVVMGNFYGYGASSGVPGATAGGHYRCPIWTFAPDRPFWNIPKEAVIIEAGVWVTAASFTYKEIFTEWLAATLGSSCGSDSLPPHIAPEDLYLNSSVFTSTEIADLGLVGVYQIPSEVEDTCFGTRDVRYRRAGPKIPIPDYVSGSKTFVDVTALMSALHNLRDGNSPKMGIVLTVGTEPIVENEFNWWNDLDVSNTLVGEYVKSSVGGDCYGKTINCFKLMSEGQATMRSVYTDSHSNFAIHDLYVKFKLDSEDIKRHPQYTSIPSARN